MSLLANGNRGAKARPLPLRDAAVAMRLFKEDPGRDEPYPAAENQFGAALITKAD
jgi:hypothetical protein